MTENLDPRLEKFFEKVERDIGLLSTDNNRKSIESDLDDQDIEYEHVDKYDNGNVTIGKYEGQTIDKEIYYAEFMQRVSIDDYVVCTYQFDHKPTSTEIKAADDMVSARVNFKVGMVDPEFQCWECGCDSHVLDSDLLDGFEDKEKVSRITDIAKEGCCCK